MNDIIAKYSKILKSPKILITAGIIGLILIFLSSLSGGKDNDAKKNHTTEMTAEMYKASLEKDIKNTVIGITGNKNVTVVITLESGIRYSYADIREETKSEKLEKENKVSDNELKEGYITVKNADGGEQALLITTEMPEVRGVAIVCDGGDDEYICEKIQNAVMAALDITSNRVYICGRNT